MTLPTSPDNGRRLPVPSSGSHVSLSSRAGQIRTISHCFCGSQGILKADGLRAILVVERDQHPVIIQENGVHKNLNQCFALFLLRYIELSEFHQPEPDEIDIEGWLSQFFISDFCSQLILLSFQGIQTFLGRSGE